MKNLDNKVNNILDNQSHDKLTIDDITKVGNYYKLFLALN